MALAGGDVALPGPPRLPGLPVDLGVLPGITWSLNTGTIGAVLPDVASVPGAAEEKGLLTAAPAGVTLANFVVNAHPAWLASGGTAKGVSPVQTAGNANSAPLGSYRYDMRFFTHCAKRASLRFCYAADNRVAFQLNGATIVPAAASPELAVQGAELRVLRPGQRAVRAQQAERHRHERQRPDRPVRDRRQHELKLTS